MLTHQKPAQYRISVSQKKRCKYHRLLLSDRSTGSTFHPAPFLRHASSDNIFLLHRPYLHLQFYTDAGADIPDLMYFRLWLQNQFFRCTADGFPFRQNMQNQFSTHSCNQNGIRFIWKQCLCPVRKPGLYIFLQPGCPDMFLCPGKRSSLISIAMAPFIFCLCTSAIGTYAWSVPISARIPPVVTMEATAFILLDNFIMLL